MRRRHFLTGLGATTLLGRRPAAGSPGKASVTEMDGGSAGNFQATGEVSWEEYGTRTEARLAHWGKHGRAPTESVILRGKRQLFVDNYVVEHMDNLTKTLHQPAKHEANPVLKADRPWEGNVDWASVIHDEEERLFKTWYLTANGLAYATSKDGIHWDKPSLGVREWGGNKDNSLVRPVVVSPTTIKDPYETRPDRKYKMFALETRPYAMYVAFSPDGIRWQRRDQPVLTSANDPGMNDRPTMMQDHQRRRFIALLKRELINPHGGGDWGFIHRCRTVSVSDDFERWTNPVLTLRPDDMDPPDLQIYGLVGFNYEGQYLGLADIYRSGASGPNQRTVETQLACSRDGEVWWRAGGRRTFIPLGPEGSWDRFGVYPNNCAPIRVGNELFIYYDGDSRRHQTGSVPSQRRGEPWFAPGHPEDPPLEPGVAISGVGLAHLRVDGFVSLDAGPRPGRLLTRPLIFAGRNLHVNVDSRQGNIKAEILEVEPVESEDPGWNWKLGNPAPGFDLAACIPVQGDSTDAIVRWRGNPTLEPFTGRPMVIRFQLTQASLFSFWIE